LGKLMIRKVLSPVDTSDLTNFCSEFTGVKDEV
jgi:hypothetical protein